MNNPEHITAIMECIHMTCDMFGINARGMILIIDKADGGVDVGVDVPEVREVPELLQSIADVYQQGINQGKV